MSASGEPSLLLHRVSDSFRELWPALARELGVTLAEWTPTQDELPAPDAAALLIAAGGHEAELVTLLPQLSAARRIPIIVAGALASHRLAIQLLAAGAADYYALPDDRDGLRGFRRAWRALGETWRERSSYCAKRPRLAEIERDLGAALDATGDPATARAARQRAVELYRRLGASKAAQEIAALIR